MEEREELAISLMPQWSRVTTAKPAERLLWWFCTKSFRVPGQQGSNDNRVGGRIVTREDKVQGGCRASLARKTGSSLCEELRKGSNEAIVARDDEAKE